jgi:hypothetical protein
MQVECVITPDDFVALTVHTWERMPWRHRHPFSRVWLSLFALSLVCNILLLPGALSGLYSVRGIAWPFLLPPALLGWLGIWLLTWRRRLIRRTRRALQGKEYAAYLGWQHLAIDPEGLTQANEELSVTLKWARVTSIEMATEHAFFYVPNGAAFILPRRPFPSVDAFTEFVETAKRYWGAAKKSSPAPRLVPPKRGAESEDRITRVERAGS